MLTVDAFADGRALVLHLDATAVCGRKNLVLASLSPHAPAGATYRALLAQRAIPARALTDRAAEGPYSLAGEKAGAPTCGNPS